MLGCDFTHSEEIIREQFIKGIDNQKYQEEVLQIISGKTLLNELAKVVYKLEAVKLSTNAL